MTVKLKRAYDDAQKNDGVRILVDRLWPRGVAKEDAKIDEWIKDVAPSTDLRMWFDHDPDKFETFEQKYRRELQSGDQKAAYDKLKEIQKNNQTITLVYAAKDEKHNQAVVLKKILTQ